MAILVGDATTVTFAESAFDAKIVSIDSLSINGTSTDTTHLGTPAGIRPSLKSKFKEAEMSMTVQHDPGIGVPMNKDDEETITIDWGGLGTSDVFLGFMLSYDISGVEPSGLITASVTVKLTSYTSGNLFDT